MKKSRFGVCIKNGENPASLELRKIYRILDDDRAAERRLIRVIDESGEDYLYPEDFFVTIDLPRTVEDMFGQKDSSSHG